MRAGIFGVERCGLAQIVMRLSASRIKRNGLFERSASCSRIARFQQSVSELIFRLGVTRMKLYLFTQFRDSLARASQTGVGKTQMIMTKRNAGLLLQGQLEFAHRELAA